jgi:hypothetical protein
MFRVGLLCIALVLLAGRAAEAAITTYSCKTSGVAYRLILDDDAGTLVSVMQGKETIYGVRGIKREMGTLTVNGYVSGRGTDFVLTHRFSPSITYTYGNGGQRVDSCTVE